MLQEHLLRKEWISVIHPVVLMEDDPGAHVKTNIDSLIFRNKISTKTDL